LPGDPRGWVKQTESGIQNPCPERQELAATTLRQSPVTLDSKARLIVEQTVRDHCQIRGWRLDALNVRTNHVHIVVAANVRPERVMEQFKAWCSRRLNESMGRRDKWWTEHGSTKWINDEAYHHNAIRYVLEGQYDVNNN
jgi:REP element-mobilizing transposase RayT